MSVALRASAYATGSGTTIDVPIPAGAQAGDALAASVITEGVQTLTPSTGGYVVMQTWGGSSITSSAPYMYASTVGWKLTAAQIAAGSVSIAMPTSAAWIVYAAAMSGVASVFPYNARGGSYYSCREGSVALQFGASTDPTAAAWSAPSGYATEDAHNDPASRVPQLWIGSAPQGQFASYTGGTPTYNGASAKWAGWFELSFPPAAAPTDENVLYACTGDSSIGRFDPATGAALWWSGHYAASATAARQIRTNALGYVVAAFDEQAICLDAQGEFVWYAEPPSPYAWTAIALMDDGRAVLCASNGVQYLVGVDGGTLDTYTLPSSMYASAAQTFGSQGAILAATTTTSAYLYQIDCSGDVITVSNYMADPIIGIPRVADIASDGTSVWICGATVAREYLDLVSVPLKYFFQDGAPYGTLTSLSLAPDGSLVVGDDGGYLYEFDAAGAFVGSLIVAPNPVNQVSVGPDGSIVTGAS